MLRMHLLMRAGVLALAVAAAGCSKKVPTASGPPPALVTVANPIATKVNEWDEFTGRLASPQVVELRARVSGYIDRVHFKEGSEVKQGDLLFTIDPRPYQSIVDRALADVARARHHAENARSEAKRGETLLSSKTISAEEYGSRIQAAGEAEEGLRSAEATLGAAKLDLSFTEVRAPISGRISDARITGGNLVMGGAQNATILTTIVSLDPLYCYIDVDERASLKYRTLYREGKRASALFEKVNAQMALANEQGFPHEGYLDFVDNQLNPSTGSIRARAVFPNTDRLMAPGFFARVRIPGNGEYDAVLIRDSAIGSDQGRSFVYVVGEDGKAVYRAVTLGPVVDGLRSVRNGLTAQDRVVISGLMAVRPGAPLNPQNATMNLAENTTAAVK